VFALIGECDGFIQKRTCLCKIFALRLGYSCVPQRIYISVTAWPIVNVWRHLASTTRASLALKLTHQRPSLARRGAF
jgi:hypothetical protein